MPNGQSFDLESMADEESESLKTRCIERLAVVYVYFLCVRVSLLSLIDAGRQSFCL